ncbi:hypothetical protein FN846DRAFT_904090 [Sphaerosporella brunnea]|uniref:Uncharacterized protein n=1 Tax=Sphaerosporella brunnea TaxID=1250544 RepID=A0A5J5F526_9PEZI|nr:hypothetical protein FN846DRAFT_904090 [Sphaerosporella brunnea]
MENQSPSRSESCPNLCNLEPNAALTAGSAMISSPRKADPSRVPRNCLYEGRQALAGRRSTVSFQSPMGLGGHEVLTGVRCRSAPELVLVRVESVHVEEKAATRATIEGGDSTRISNSLSVPRNETNCRRSLDTANTAASGHGRLHSLFRGASTSSLHLSMSSSYRLRRSHDQLVGSRNGDEDWTAGGQTNQVSSARKLNRPPTLTAADCNTGESDDRLSAKDVQAMGRLVPLYNDPNYDRVEANEKGTAPPAEAEKVTKTNGHNPWKAAVKRMLSREKLPGSPSRRWRAGGTKRHGSGPRFPGGVEPQITRLKKRPSIFFRLLNRTVKQNQSYAGYKPLLPNRPRILYWGNRFTSKFSIFSMFKPDELGHHHPHLVEEVLRYFGSDAVKKQLVFTAKSDPTKRGEASGVTIFHPINTRILDARHAKMEQERNCQGRLPTWTKNSFMSLRKSRLSSASKIRIINRHGENWKLLEFSKMASPKIGDGQLSLAGEYSASKRSNLHLMQLDFCSPSAVAGYVSSPASLYETLPPSPALGYRSHSPNRKTYPSSLIVTAGPHIVPTRTSSKINYRNTSMPKSIRRASVSTIGWAESIKEFEGDVGSVHVSGERELADDDRLQSPTPIRSMSRVFAHFPELIKITESGETSRTNMDDGIEPPSGKSETSRPTSRTSSLPRETLSITAHVDPPQHRNVVVSGQWQQALQVMQEFEDEIQMKNTGTRRSLHPRTWSKASSKASHASSNPEGYIDCELREACRLAVMSAGVLESKRRRNKSGSDYTFPGLFD